MKHVELSADEDRFVAILRALGNPARYFIFREVQRQGSALGSDLLANLPLAQSTVSEHLRRLREVGILTARPTGSSMMYTVDEPTLDWFRQQASKV